jgi:HD superfamily phosphohydrolase YqeK
MQCPGQDSRYWDPTAIFEANCPSCGKTMEFFKDDSSRNCKKCGERVLNPQNDFGCASYCPFAEQCLGSLPPELIAKKQNLLKDRVAVEMKNYFERDFKRIDHAARVARYAEQIGKLEQGNPAVILMTAYLHDIGIKEAERKFNSSSAKYQHQEGPPVARAILEKLHAEEKVIEEVCDIIGHHHNPREEETDNFKVVYDADLIANLQDQQRKDGLKREKIIQIINKSFFTETGKNIARKVLLTD